MFLSEGDGVVFRGANGPWKTADYEFHLKPDAAKDLIRKVLTTYAELHAGPLAELFIHGQMSFNDEEWRAFEEVAPAETNVVGVRIRTTNGETKLFRDGDYPVLRGTALILDEKNAYLWTTGYVPQLDTYIGPETPNPLFITVLKSKKTMPEVKTVLNDIMGLTKINYNSCNFNDGLPVTVRFANMVGEVLTMGSAQGTERQPFKYYVGPMSAWSTPRACNAQWLGGDRRDQAVLDEVCNHSHGYRCVFEHSVYKGAVIARPIPPSAPIATTTSGGACQTVRRMNPTSARPKSPDVFTALVQTGL